MSTLATGTPVHAQRFAGLTDDMVTADRTLYFDEHKAEGAKGPGGGLFFFITVKGRAEKLYAPDNPPAVVTQRGAVEDWTIQNRSEEVHEFHIHQVHFQLLAVDGIPVAVKKRQFYDTHQVGYWSGKGKYPSITVRLDFRGAVEGEFVYHCHILDHEDGGMMASILVQPSPPPKGARVGPYARGASLTGGSGARARTTTRT